MSTNRLQQLFQFLESTPNDPFIIFAIAKEYLSTGNDVDALKYFEKIISNHPSYVGVYYHLGKLHVKHDRLEQALKIYNQGMLVAKNNKDQHAFNELAGAKMEIDDE